MAQWPNDSIPLVNLPGTPRTRTVARAVEWKLMSRTPQRLFFAAVLVASLAGCERLKPTDLRPLDKAGMWYQSIEELRKLNPSEDEIAQLVLAREAGLSDAGCLELIRLARSREKPFESGAAVASLLRVRMSEPSVLELARLNQLGLWVGEAQAIRLAGISEEIVMTMARRRAADLPVLSGAALAQLKNVGVSEPEMLALLNRGASDAEAGRIVAARHRAATPSGFVRQRGRIPR